MIAECPPKERLAALASGRLAPSAVDPLLSHLSDCPSCGAALEQLEQNADGVMAVFRESFSDLAPLTETAFVAARGKIAAEIREGKFAAAADVLVEPAPLRRIGHYELLEKLGQGGMGEVYRALHTNLQKIVAIKLLPEDKLQDAEALRRFKQEMAAVGALDHPNIVRAFDAGQADGQHYLVMEYVEGIDLSRLMKRHGPLPIADACEIIRQAAIGLEHAHEHGRVHRDIKPSNLMLAHRAVGSGQQAVGEERKEARSSSPTPHCPLPTPILKILDLGLARLRGHSPDGELTRESQIMGTLDYMAPEQAASSRDVDIRADIYSLGATLYKLLCGRAPFDSRDYDSPVQLLAAQITQPVTPIEERRIGVPPVLAAVIGRMLSKDPHARPATPAAVERLLTPLAAGSDLGGLWKSAGLGRAAPASADLATLSTEEFLKHPLSDTHTVPAPAIGAPVAGKISAETQPLAVAATFISRISAARPPWFRWLVAGGIACLAFVLFGVVMHIATDYGTLVIDVPDEMVDTVKIEVLRGGKKINIVDLKTKHTFSLRSGKYELKLAGDKSEQYNLLLNNSLLTGQFELRRGDAKIADVRLIEPTKPPVAGDLGIGGGGGGALPHDGAQISLRNVASQSFLKLHLGNVGVSTDGQETPKADCLWLYEKATDGEGARLKHAQTGKYLDAAPDGSLVGVANRSTDQGTVWVLKPADSARLKFAQPGDFAIRHVLSGKYLGEYSSGRVFPLINRVVNEGDLWQLR